MDELCHIVDELFRLADLPMYVLHYLCDVSALTWTLWLQGGVPDNRDGLFYDLMYELAAILIAGFDDGVFPITRQSLVLAGVDCVFNGILTKNPAISESRSS